MLDERAALTQEKRTLTNLDDIANIDTRIAGIDSELEQIARDLDVNTDLLWQEWRERRNASSSGRSYLNPEQGRRDRLRRQEIQAAKELLGKLYFLNRKGRTEEANQLFSSLFDPLKTSPQENPEAQYQYSNTSMQVGASMVGLKVESGIGSIGGIPEHDKIKERFEAKVKDLKTSIVTTSDSEYPVESEVKDNSVHVGYVKEYAPGSAKFVIRWTPDQGKQSWYKVDLSKVKNNLGKGWGKGQWDKFFRDNGTIYHENETVKPAYKPKEYNDGPKIGFINGLKTGSKGVINGSYSAIISTLSLGYADGGDLIPVDPTTDLGYETSKLIAKSGGELLIGVGTGGLAALSTATKFKRVGQFIYYFDAAGNVVGVARGAKGIYDDGEVNISDVANIAGGAIGLGGNYLGRHAGKVDEVLPDGYRPGNYDSELPNSDPIGRSVGALSRGERLAKKYNLNLNSPTARQILNSLDNSVQSFISKYRSAKILREMPSEVLGMSIEEALSHSTKVRKLLTDGRFVK